MLNFRLTFLFIICWISISGISSCNINLLKKRDTDRDGISNRSDRCPDTPIGVKVDPNGCPVDTDQDGVADYQDNCPDVTGVASLNGCADSDFDGIADAQDECPDQAGTGATKGCPESDGDGVADKDDACPGTPLGTIVDSKGCPLDSDGDGLADALDKCPDNPLGYPVDANGCPILASEPGNPGPIRKPGKGINRGGRPDFPGNSNPPNRPNQPGQQMSSQLSSSDKGRLEEKLRGTLVYYLPDTMKVDSTYKASLTISKYQIKKILKEEIELSIDRRIDTSKIKSITIDIFKRMAANITCGDTSAFRILNTSSDDKYGFIAQDIDLEDTTSTNWFWDVTPLKGGRYTLTVSVNKVTGPDLIKESKPYRVYHKTIPVIAIPPGPLDQVEAWLKMYPSIWSILIIPLLGWGYREFFKERLKRKCSREEV